MAVVAASPSAEAFKAEAFEDLHARAVTRLVVPSGRSGREPESEAAAAFSELRAHKEALARPFTFRGREDTVDLPSLARHVHSQSPRLASEPLVRAVDEVSRALRLHQLDCCVLVERALDMGGRAEVARNCAGMYYRECHFQALCLHDMAQSLVQRPPNRHAVAFFAMLGGRDRRFSKALFEALGALLRDLTGEKTGDQMFQTHAGIMIQLLVETMFAYFFAFGAHQEDAEQLLSLLPHVVTQQHAPIGQGFTVSDLDLVLREGHAEISTKLCLALVCMFGPRKGNVLIDLSKVPEDIEPGDVRRVLESLQGSATDGFLGATPLGAKMRAGDYWNEESQLGQFLGFAIGGVLLDDEKALRNGYIHWHVLHFLLHEALLSPSIVGKPCTSRLVVEKVLVCIHELLERALLPVGQRWLAVKKLEAQAVNYRLLAPDALQITLLQILNRLCRAHPTACETFREIAVHCTDTFHLHVSQGAHLDRGGLGGWSQAGVPGSALGAPAMGSFALQPGGGGASAWIGAPHSTAAGAANTPAYTTVRHDSTLLYAEIIDFLATLIGRGSMHCARLMCQKLLSHSNQWFNWNFLVDTLAQEARAAGVHGASRRPAPVLVALGHLVAAVCSNRLWVSQPSPPQPSTAPGGNAALSAAGPAMGLGGPQAAEAFGRVLMDLLCSHPEPSVKAACLGAVAQLDFTVEQAKRMLTSLNSRELLATLLGGICDVRGSADGALAIELLACALRLAQVVPLNKGRYGIDLQPLTEFTIRYIYLKVLADPSQFSSAPRYWRLASLALRWLRLVLRGPLPLGAVRELNAAIIEPYAETDSDAVANVTAAGNATAFAFRCMLTLDSPVFARVMYLVLLRGHGVDGLAEGFFTDQVAQVGLDILRLLLQRDVLFKQLYGQQAAERAADGAAGQESGASLLLVHNPLFSEFLFSYPPSADDGAPGGGHAVLVGNPFAAQRLWQGPPNAATGALGEPNSSAAISGKRTNPSYFSLLTEYVGARSHPDISKLALFVMTQCALREPAITLRMLKLEPRRMNRLSSDLHDLLLQPEEDTAVMAVSQPLSRWGPRTEEQFMFEAIEMDLPPSPDVTSHLGAISFQTGLPVCGAVDAVHQLADDALLQSADLAVWTCSAVRRGGRGTSPTIQSNVSADAGRFRAGYLRGFDVRPSWLSSMTDAGSVAAACPPPALATATRRLLALRSFALLLGGVLLDDAAGVASKLGQALLGLDPEGATGSLGMGAQVDVDLARAGEPKPLEALMEILENPPPVPHVPLDSGAIARSGLENTGLQPPGANAGVTQALDQHAAYEAALGIVAALLAAPALRDVTLRFMCLSWPSRYRVLGGHLALPWAQLPPPLRRVLLSEATLMLHIAACEMRLVHPLGVMASLSGTEPESLSIAGSQRLDMRRKVAEQLRDVVRSFVAPPAETEAARGEASTPLVAAALRLAEVCEAARDKGAPQRQGSTPILQDSLQEMLRASSCACLAPSGAGPLALGLELQDPHLFLSLVGSSRMRAWRSLASGGAGASFVMGGADAAAGMERGVEELQAALDHLSASNESACVEYFARVSFQAFALFASAAFYHLVDSTRPRAAGARDPRGQIVRAHLEALLPSLSSSALSRCSPLCLELLAELATVFVAAMQEIEGPVPLAFAYNLFCSLRSVALHPLGTPNSSFSVQRALLLLVQRMLPDLRSDPHDHMQAEVDAADLAELQRLVAALLAQAATSGSGAAASSTAGSATRDAAALADFRFGGVEALLASARASLSATSAFPSSAASSTSGAGSPEAALALLAALLARVPRSQLPRAFGGPVLWRQLVAVLDAPQASQRLHSAAACVSAVLCQAPPLALGFFEYGGLAAVLRGRHLQAAHIRVALPGLQALDGPHPAQLLAVLQVLAAVLGALPSHRFVLRSTLEWLEQQSKPLLDLLQWINRLPLATTLEPRSRDLVGVESPSLFGALGAGLAGATNASTVMNAVAASSAGTMHRSALLLLCVGRDEADAAGMDSTLDLAASLIVHGDSWCLVASAEASAGRGFAPTAGVAAKASSQDLEARDRIVALCHRCALLAAEVWALLSAAVLRSGDPSSVVGGGYDPLHAAMERLTLQLEPALLNTLAQNASLAVPQVSREANVGGGGVGGASLGGMALGGMGAMNMAVDSNEMLAGGNAASDAMAQQGLYPSEPTRMAVCLRIMQAWRYDPVAQQLQAVAEGYQNDALRTHGGWAEFSAPPGASATAQAWPGTAALAQSLTRARSRAGALCTVFVHACDALLSLRFAGASPSRAAGIGSALGDRPHLQFEGSRARFRHLLILVEMALQLLCANLGALVIAAGATGSATAAAPSPATGAPRFALVVQHLQLLQQFAVAVGGAVVPTGSALSSGEGAAPPPSERVDLNFSARLAERVERLLTELQSL